MKKSVIFALIAAAFMSFGCAKDSGLNDKVNDLEKRVSTLEQQVKDLNEKTIPGIQAIITAIRKGEDSSFIYVKAITTTDDGYLVTFSNGTTAEVSKKGDKGDKGETGEQGPQGETGRTPVISAKEVDGEFVWTADGVVITDAEGNPIPVHQALPQLRIKDGKWQVSYDKGETWADVPTLGQAAPAITIEDKDTEVIFIIDGKSYSVKKELPFFMTFEQRKDIGIPQGETYYFEYTISGIADGDQVEVDILNVTSGWEAEVVSVATASAPGYIAVTNVDNTTGKVFVYATNGKGKTDIKSLQFEGGELKVVADVKPVVADGGEITIAVTTNMGYDVSVDEDQDWLTIAPETKATHTDNVTLVAEKNESGEFRCANAYITNSQTGEIVETISVLQYPSPAVTTDLSSIFNVEDDSVVEIYSVAVVATSKSSAVVSDGINLLYVTGKSLPVGKEVTIKGTKSSIDAWTAFVDVTSFQITKEESAIAATEINYIGYAPWVAPSSTLTSGVLQVESIEGEDKYVLYTPMGDLLVIEDPTDDLYLETRVENVVNVTGYVTYVIEEGEENNVSSFIVANVANLTVKENPNWTLSYSYDASKSSPEIITNTVQGEGSRYYFAEQLYSVEEMAEEYGVESAADMGEFASIMLPDDLQYYMYYYYAGMGDLFYELYTYGETAEVELSEVDFGKYYAVVAGVAPDGLPTGEYKVLEFEKKNPYVEASYSDYLGKWIVGGKTIEVTEKTAGETYNISGLASGTNNPDALVEGVFDSEAGNMTISEQYIGSYTSSSYGLCYEYVTGIFAQGTSTYAAYPFNTSAPTVAVTAWKTTEGGIEWKGGSCKYGSFMALGTCWVIQEGSYKGQGNKSIVVGLPQTLEKAPEADERYTKWLGLWTVEHPDYDDEGKPITTTDVWNITEGVPNQTFMIEGIEGTSMAVYGYAVQTVFDDETGSMVFEAQKLNEWTHSSVGTVKEYLYGKVSVGGGSALITGTGYPIATLSMTDDNTATFEALDIVISETTYTFNGLGIYQNYGGKNYSLSGGILFTNPVNRYVATPTSVSTATRRSSDILLKGNCLTDVRFDSAPVDCKASKGIEKVAMDKTITRKDIRK